MLKLSPHYVTEGLGFTSDSIITDDSVFYLWSTKILESFYFFEHSGEAEGGWVRGHRPKC